MIPFPFQMAQMGRAFQPSVGGLVFVGGSTAAGTSGGATASLTALTGGVGSAAAEGDLVIVALLKSAGTDTTLTTSGYDKFVDLFQGSTYNQYFSLSKKFMSASPDTSVTGPGTGSGNRAMGLSVQVWRNVNSASPLDVTSTTASGTTGVIDSPSITPSTSGSVVLSAGGFTMGADPATPTIPSGYSNGTVVSSLGGTHDVCGGIASMSWVSGAEDPPIWGNCPSSSAAAWCACSVVLRPA